jgi:hypothetical protein
MSENVNIIAATTTAPIKFSLPSLKSDVNFVKMPVVVGRTTRRSVVITSEAGKPSPVSSAYVMTKNIAGLRVWISKVNNVATINLSLTPEQNIDIATVLRVLYYNGIGQSTADIPVTINMAPVIDRLYLKTNSLDFGTVAYGESATREVTLGFTGEAPNPENFDIRPILTDSYINIYKDRSVAAVLTPVSADAEGEITFTVKYAPIAGDALATTDFEIFYTINDVKKYTLPVTYGCSGYVAPTPSTAPIVDLTAPAPATPQTLDYVLTNTAPEHVTLRQITFMGDSLREFSLVGGSLEGVIVAPKDTKAISVLYTPKKPTISVASVQAIGLID